MNIMIHGTNLPLPFDGPSDLDFFPPNLLQLQASYDSCLSQEGSALALLF